MISPVQKSLLSKLVISFSLLSLTTVGVVALNAYYQAKLAIEKSVFERLSATASIQEEEIDNWFTIQRQDVLLSAQLPEISKQAELLFKNPTAKNSNPETQVAYQNLTQYFKNLTKIKPNLQEISLLTNNGLVAFSTNQSLEGKSQPLDNNITYFKAEKTKVKPIFYQSPTTGKFTVTLATPIFNQAKQRIGILAVNLNLDTINYFVEKQTHLGESGKTYLISQLNQKNTLVSATASENNRYSQGLTSIAIDAAIAQQDGQGLYKNHDGKSVLGIYRWIDEQDLALVTEIEQKEAFVPARIIASQIFIISLGSSVLLLLSVYWFSRRITSPILSLTQAAKEIANGNFNYQAYVSSQDEIGALASSFNQMARQLQNYFDNLETKVEQRTAELNKLLNQQQIAKEQLQQRVQQLQEQLKPVNQGDLTIRATVTDDELGLLANSYNSIIENLEKIVAQVKAATQTVAETTNRNENAIAKLATGTSYQKEEISFVLNRIEMMVKSMDTLASRAAKAEIIIKQTNEKVQKGDQAINETVERILALGETTSATKEQVKRLGKASRKISKAVELIRKIALQTNVLAVNASIEAARAGEEGLGFNVVADEVQSLASRSAQTATDIEALVLEIQAETDKVVRAMEESSKEVLAGSQLMKQTRSSLQQLTTTSEEVNQLVEAIALALREQSQTSQTVTKTIQQVAAIVSETSSSATDVSGSFQELLSISQQLQNSVGKFRVN
ncbi:methyl-accepting chemotaxis sensory transducer with Cache sensor [Stanieria cyanosphaera PCC 7437]|uniref:Methyl-accepting chemotaxis sensory transducer with Cache sensor n=1 Tax=Stanieria cyanosphaera (strain ATCC 29371 / PCC 7437) TaxID=111780 RepID=K9XUV3_STAC7|nr:methyl-accepting chemotaxis protein [Stanieria cyanosphaera]AFZ36318.1 methyl-accepting chemotaxis sensory transducer with Cache sensor [Stanieria cyanosphaera PCC 7437]